MTKTIFCQKMHQELPAMAFSPYPGELGQRLMDTISQPAWKLWLKHQTMLINEQHLSLADAKTRTYLTGEMEKFLFGGDYDKPEGYVPEN